MHAWPLQRAPRLKGCSTSSGCGRPSFSQEQRADRGSRARGVPAAGALSMRRGQTLEAAWPLSGCWHVEDEGAEGAVFRRAQRGAPLPGKSALVRRSGDPGPSRELRVLSSRGTGASHHNKDGAVSEVHDTSSQPPDTCRQICPRFERQTSLSGKRKSEMPGGKLLHVRRNTSKWLLIVILHSRKVLSVCLYVSLLIT
jgi:hypothetical protein